MGMHKGLIGQSDGGGSVSPTYEDKTLGDYIARKQRQDAFDQVAQEKKLTFEQWLAKSSFVEPDTTTREWLKDCWKAAQANV